MFSFNKGVLKLTHDDSRACASRSYLALGGVKLFGSCLDRVDLEKEFYKKTSVCLVEFIFRSCVKIDSIDMLKFIHTRTSFNMFDFRLAGFGFQIHIYMVFMNR